MTEPENSAPLPGPVRDFWYAASALGERFQRTPWGALMTDSRYPLIYDANNATVLEPAPDLTMDEVLAPLRPALREAGAHDEHIEVWETSVESHLLREIRRLAPAQRADVVMMFETGPPLPDAALVEIREVAEPDESFWAWYEPMRAQYGEQMTQPVLDQLAARDRALFVPAGLRFLVGMVDGLEAGFASLLSLDGVGYIDNVITLPGFRRRGVATATVSAAVRTSLGRGDRTMFLLAEENGDPQRLYERLGFRTRSRIESLTRPLPLTDLAH
jgi:ribosomal protein S18 acetylase RimI-like enzyme